MQSFGSDFFLPECSCAVNCWTQAPGAGVIALIPLLRSPTITATTWEFSKIGGPILGFL